MILKWIKLIVINFLIIILLLIVIDPIIPIFTSQKNGTPPRSIRMQEHYSNRVSNIKFGSDEILFRTNENGYIIGPNYVNNYTDNILFLGSSTTECLLVDEDKRFPYYTVELINKKLKTKYVSLNGASGITNLFHSYLNLLTKTSYPNKKPNYLFLTVGISDFGYLDAIGNYLEGPRGVILINYPSIFKILKTVKDVFFSNVYLASKKLFEIKIPSNIQGGVDNFTPYNNSYLKENEDLLFSQWNKTLELIISYCNINNIKLIIVVEHNIDILLEKTDYSRLRILNRKKINKILYEKSKQNGIPLIDLDILLEKTKSFYQDQSHLNNTGSIEVSKILSDFFIKDIFNENN